MLTNVKTRGVFGEVQLAGLLEQVFTPEQYATNVATVPGRGERVEFAIRLPGQRVDGAPLWLPIDAKFPREDYERLLDAQERADPVAAEASARAIEMRLRSEARSIRDKYVAPPHTTDFAILFVPTEGLYAEALRRPGLVEALQREHKVMLAGPTTLLATLEQPADGLSHAGAGAAQRRSLGSAGCGEDRVRQVRRRAQQDPRTSSTRPPTPSPRPKRAAARWAARCARSRRCPKRRRSGCCPPKLPCRATTVPRVTRHPLPECSGSPALTEPDGPLATRRLPLLLALIAGQIGVHATMAGVRLAAPLQALRDGHSAWSVGVLLALYAAGPVLLSLHAGRMADRLGYHRPVRLAIGLALFGAALAVASTFVTGRWPFALLCVSALFVGSAANLGLIVAQRNRRRWPRAPAPNGCACSAGSASHRRCRMSSARWRPAS